jgi:hypothetical protein
MNKWILNYKAIDSIEDIPDYENVVGFIYRITNARTGKFYIGKKNLQHSRKTRITKKEKLETKTRKTFKKVIKESDWLTYYGSSKELSADVAKYGEACFTREIVQLCKSKKYLSYCEIEWQIKLDVLRADSYNGNILGRYYKKDMI